MNGGNFSIIFPRVAARKAEAVDIADYKQQKTTQKQEEILAYLKGNPLAGRKELTRHIKNITEDGIKYNLRKLQQKGLLKRIGPDKGGYWEVVEDV